MQLLTTLEISRRTMLRSSLAAAACSLIPGMASASINAAFKSPARTLALYTPHSGEILKTIYWEKGVYHSEPLKDISYMMRDQHSGDMSPIDPRLLDILYAVQNTLGSKHPIEIVCGYRTPRNNAYLYKHERGVGRNSYHMYGRAIDIRMADRSAAQIARAAWTLQQGGVGHYPHAGFVHVDTGGVRRW